MIQVTSPAISPASPPKGLTSVQVQALLAKFGPNAISEKRVSAWRQVLGFFTGPIPWMIEAAAVMALIVGDYGDFFIILGMLLFNAGLGFWEEHQAANALSALKSSLAQTARALRDGQWQVIAAAQLVPGDAIQLRLGDIIPADVQLVQGDYLSVDQSALTGESLPVSKKILDTAYSGSIVKKGEMIGVVTQTGSRTFFGKTASLVQAAGAASHFQKAVMKIGNFLVAVAAGLAVVLIAVQLARHEDFFRVAEFVLILLVAAVPVAMPAVLSSTMAMGALLLAKRKVIVSRLEAIEEMSGMDILCSDKTGTLTQNKLTLGDVFAAPGSTVQDVLLAGCLACRAADRDPMDLAVLGGWTDTATLNSYKTLSYTPFDPVLKRTAAVVQDSAGKTVWVTKGTPQVVFALAGLTGADLQAAQDVVEGFARKGYRTLAVARAEQENQWVYLGILPLFDPPRPDSKSTIAAAEDYGIAVKMVTGDNQAIACQIAAQLGMGSHIQVASDLLSSGKADGAAIERADGFAQVFPEHKYEIVKSLQDRGHVVGMTGDGANDAPALKQADVGIAVSGATDAARAAAALILTEPGLSVIISGIEEARRIFARMTSYSIYRIAMTTDIMFFIVLATLVYGSFPLTPLMIIALALLDDLPILCIAFDRAEVAPRPLTWNMKRLLGISSVLGILAVIESFGLMVIGDSWMGLPAAQLQTLMFLQLMVGGHLMLFVARTKSFLWSRPWPDIRLVLAIAGTQVFAMLMAAFGFGVPSLSWELIGLVWGYCLVWMLVQDIAKVFVYRLMKE